MAKRTMWLISLTVIVSMVLVACGPTPAAPTEAPPPTEAPTPVPTEAPTEVPPTEVPPPPAVEIDCMGAASGDGVSVVYQWSGAEEEKFNAVVKPLVDACGIKIVSTSHFKASCGRISKFCPSARSFFGKLIKLRTI